jgi:hypothetical protein
MMHLNRVADSGYVRILPTEGFESTQYPRWHRGEPVLSLSKDVKVTTFAGESLPF